MGPHLLASDTFNALPVYLINLAQNDEWLWPGVMTLVAAILSSAVTGLITYFVTYKSVERQISSSNYSRRAELILRVNAFCQGLKTEIIALKRRREKTIGAVLDELGEGAAFLSIHSAEEEYFTFYHTNARSLGLIADEKLRSKIIEVYVEMKGHLDSIKINSWLVDRFLLISEMRENGERVALPGKDHELEVLWSALSKQGLALKREQRNIRRITKIVLWRLERYDHANYIDESPYRSHSPAV